MNKEFKQFIRKLLREGWTVTQGKKAFKLRSPGGRLVACSISPSCPFAVKHLQADVRRVMREERKVKDAG